MLKTKQKDPNAIRADASTRMLRTRDLIQGTAVGLPHTSSDAYQVAKITAKSALRGFTLPIELQNKFKNNRANGGVLRISPDYPLISQRITPYLSSYTRKYINKHGHLPYVVAETYLDMYKGVSLISGQTYFDVNTYVTTDSEGTEVSLSSMFMTINPATATNELIFVTDMLSSPENVYIEQDDECGNIAQMSGGQAYDEWKIFSTEQANHDYFYARRNAKGGSTSDTASHNPIYEFLLIFAFCSGEFVHTRVSDLDEVHENLSNLYAKMVADLWSCLTKGRSATQTEITLTVGNMFKMLVGMCSAFSCGDYSRVLSINGPTVESNLAKCVIGTSISMSYEKIQLFAPATINNWRKDKLRFSNMSFKFRLPFNRLVTLNGTQYGIITQAGDPIEYWFESPDGETAVGYVAGDLDWADAVNETSSILSKIFEFKHPVKISYSGLVVLKHYSFSPESVTDFSITPAYHGAMETTWRPLFAYEFRHDMQGFSTYETTYGKRWFKETDAGDDDYLFLSFDDFKAYETTPKYYKYGCGNNYAVRLMKNGGSGQLTDIYALHPYASMPNGAQDYVETRQYGSTTINYRLIKPMAFENYMYSDITNPTIRYRACLPFSMPYETVCKLVESNSYITMLYTRRQWNQLNGWERISAGDKNPADQVIRLVYIPKNVNTRNWSNDDWSAHEIRVRRFSCSNPTNGPNVPELQPHTIGQFSLYIDPSSLASMFALYGEGQVAVVYYANQVLDGEYNGDYMYLFTAPGVRYELEDAVGNEYTPYPASVELAWTPRLQRFVGSLEHPTGEFGSPFNYTKSSTLENYLTDEYCTRIKDVVTNAIIKRIFATDVDPEKLAQLLRFCQDDREGGLEVDTEILRNLVVNSQEVRTVRTGSILQSISEMLDFSDLNDQVTKVFSSTVTTVKESFDTASQQMRQHFSDFTVNVTEENKQLIEALGLQVEDYVTDGKMKASDYITLCKTAQDYVASNATDSRENIETLLATAKEQFISQSQQAADYWKNVKFVPDVDWDFDFVTPTFDLEALKQSYMNNFNTLKQQVDTDFIRDNPELAPLCDWDSSLKSYVINVKKWWENVDLKTVIPNLDIESFESPEIAELYESGNFMELVAYYNSISDVTAELMEEGLTEEAESLKKQSADCASLIKCVRGQLIDEYTQLTANILNFKYEDALDDIADDENTLSTDDAFGTISSHIDDIQKSLTDSIDFSDIEDTVKAGCTTVADDTAKIKSLISQKFSTLATQTSAKAKEYYSELCTKVGEAKEGIQTLTNMVSFSASTLIEKVKANVSDVQTFLQQMVGISNSDASSYGWQSSTLFTPRSNISISMGCVATGLTGAISAVFGLVGKVISGAAEKVRGAVMSIVEDGVSFRRRSKGFNTLSLQACLTEYSKNYFHELYPDLHDKLWDDSHPEAGVLRGDNSKYAALQVGPLLLFLQDFTDEWADQQCMVTLNPVIIDEDDSLKEGSDYTFAVRMCESIRYSRRFINTFMDKAKEMKLFNDFVPYYPEVSVNEMLKDIYAKSEGTSAAEAWGWRGLILGLGVAAGAILCCTGYGTAAGIALIAGVTIAAECMTAGTAVDQSVIEHLENDKAYANATIKSTDLASIWTDCIPESAIRLILSVVDKLTNLHYQTETLDVHLDLVHDGRGDNLDINAILGTNADDYPNEIGYVPMIQGVRYPNFRYSLVTDLARAAYATAGIVALSIPCFILVKNATVASLNKWKKRRAAKKEAKAWSLEDPSKEDFTKKEPVLDKDGNPIKTKTGKNKTKTVFDEEAYNKAKKKYTKKQAKLAYKRDRIADSCIESDGGSGDGTGSGLLASIIPSESAADETLNSNIVNILNRLG